MIIIGRLVLLAVLGIAAFFVFRRVDKDYQSLGKLSRTTAVLQVIYFFAYALSSYAFFDSRWSQVYTENGLLILAVLLMAVGLLIILFSMPFLGRRSFGMRVGTLRTKGLYGYSRNPQLVGSFLFLAGYALLWPSWSGFLWVSLWLLICTFMVGAEEAHLRNVFGDEYLDYCRHTPRYIGLIKQG